MRACAKAYGEEFFESINIGLDTDTRPDKGQLAYMAQCLKVLWRHGKKLDDMIGGIAAGSGRTSLDIARLFFEGMGTVRNCTAVAATGRGTLDGNPIIGMNWDGPVSLYPWARLLRFSVNGWPRMLLYSSRPGQVPCAGINEHGMSLVWTSADPSIRQRFKEARVGVPTYCQIAGVLACKDCREAIALLKEAPNAGGFIFLLADAKGKAWVVEAVPSRIHCVECPDATGRANHLESPELIRLSGQQVPVSTPMNNTAARGQRIHELVSKYYGRIDRPAVEAMLGDSAGRPGHTICRNRVKGDPCMTIDSFYLLPAKRQLWIARGLPSRHKFECHRV